MDDMHFKEEILAALKTPADSEEYKGMTVREQGVRALLKKFCSGDLKAFEVIRDTVGEKPVPRQEPEDTQGAVFVFQDIDMEQRG